MLVGLRGGGDMTCDLGQQHTAEDEWPEIYKHLSEHTAIEDSWLSLTSIKLYARGSYLTMSTRGGMETVAQQDSLTGEAGPYYGFTPRVTEGLYTATEHSLRRETPTWTRTHTLLMGNDTLYTGMAGNMSVDTSNYTTVRTVISLHYDLPVMIVVGVILLLLTLTTAFGNLLVGLALFKFRQLKTVSNYLIGNLALSDFLLATTILPLSTVYECLGYWVFGEVLCYFWLMADVLYCTASIWNLAIIALDRFTATLYPLWYREKRSAKSAAIYIAIVWVFSVAICVPPLLGWNDITTSFQYMNDTGVHQCMLFQSQSYVMYSASGSFFIPFLITVFLYIRIFVVLKKRMRKMRVSSKSHAQKAQKKADTNLLNNVLKKDHDIELSQVPNNKSSSGPTEELSSKSLFGSGTESGGENEDDDSSTQLKSDQPLYVSSSEAEVPTKLLRNGTREKGSKKEKETLVILNPHHRFSDSEKDSDRDHIQIVITEDNTTPLKTDGKTNQEASKLKLKNTVLTLSKEKLSIPGENGKTSNKRKVFTNALKNANPFTRGSRDKQRSSQKSAQKCGHKRYDQREVRATIRMAIIIACFCGCWLGFFVIYVVRSWCGANCNIPREVDAFFFWLGYSNSSMNPVLYAIFNEEFRRAFQKLLGCYKRSSKKNGLRH